MSGISRRRFLAASIAGCAATTLAVPKKALASGAFSGYPDSMGVLVDLSRCIGCRSCEAACNEEQNLPAPRCHLMISRFLTRLSMAEHRNGVPMKMPTRWLTGITRKGANRSIESFNAITAQSLPVSVPVSSTPTPRRLKGLSSTIRTSASVAGPVWSPARSMSLLIAIQVPLIRPLKMYLLPRNQTEEWPSACLCRYLSTRSSDLWQA